MKTDKAPSKNKTLVTKLLFAVVGMFAFGFALVPLYDVICDITGLNGKTNNLAIQAEAGEIIDETREITVQFIARENADMNWGFTPSSAQVKVQPGEVNMISYKVTNSSDRVMVGQAIPSVAPNGAAGHLNKVECFCFEEQVLQPGESADMPLRFFVDPALPTDISKLTLSYTLYDITEKSSKLKAVAAR
ncbi:cytochrome c oxidase assembly protein [Pseudohongiella acticola]|jgi:cytochrome c oxidase assembly protein subunit 11|uniref:Cytochrome c oxidase assembly protein CtaG n=1 Tax=Pseudohongiella acticola TaxID=1524254 RepID=A0A1E8CLF2_9GAMM|nr:cytochrome c oxidase assembly protein [Pseudohongiella acticola]OFE13301.1 cytochrome c oxidase assembly protein [Pseudohongiella acticola]